MPWTQRSTKWLRPLTEAKGLRESAWMSRELFHIESIPDSRALRVEFRGQRGNSLDSEVLDVLRELLRAESPRPILLGARGRSFCTGLDLLYSVELDREGMRRLMRKFRDTLTALALYPGPVVALLGGHALAGGSLLALAADFRIIRREGARFGSHGFRLGIAYPGVAIELARHSLGNRGAEDLFWGAELLEGGAALARGWVDALGEAEDLPRLGHEYLEAIPSLEAFAENKSRLRQRLADALFAEARNGASEERFLDHWFGSPTQERVQEAAQALSGRSGARPGEEIPPRGASRERLKGKSP